MRGMDLLNSEIDLGTIIIWNNKLNSNNNCTTNECLQSYSQMSNQSMPSDTINSFFPSVFFQIIIYTLYTLIFILALVGNLVVVAVVFASVRKWTVRIYVIYIVKMNLNLNHFQKQNNNKKVTNFFIVNMAAGDILMAIFCIPFTFVPTFILLYWPFGAAMCRVVSFSQAVSVFVSAYTMVAISSDRYLAIVYPLRPRMTRKQAKVQLFKLKNLLRNSSSSFKKFTQDQDFPNVLTNVQPN